MDSCNVDLLQIKGSQNLFNVRVLEVPCQSPPIQTLDFPSDTLNLGVRGLFALLSFVFVFGGFFCFVLGGWDFFCFGFWVFWGVCFQKY